MLYPLLLIRVKNIFAISLGGIFISIMIQVISFDEATVIRLQADILCRSIQNLMP